MADKEDVHMEGDVELSRQRSDSRGEGKAYRAKVDVSIPRPISRLSKEGEEEVWATEGVNYPAGTHVLSENMTPRDRERAEKGELDHLLEPASLEDAQNAPVGEPEFAVFVPEHEAEAHVLETYGHGIVPGEQQLEMMSAGAENARAYQEAVKGAGLDERPVQTMLAQERERVPDEILEGAETRTGMPHNREPQVVEAPDDAATVQPRPRPGSE